MSERAEAAPGGDDAPPLPPPRRRRRKRRLLLPFVVAYLLGAGTVVGLAVHYEFGPRELERTLWGLRADVERELRGERRTWGDVARGMTEFSQERSELFRELERRAAGQDALEALPELDPGEAQDDRPALEELEATGTD